MNQTDYGASDVVEFGQNYLACETYEHFKPKLYKQNIFAKITGFKMPSLDDKIKKIAEKLLFL